MNLKKTNVIRESPDKKFYILPSEIDISKRFNIRSSTEQEVLLQSILCQGFANPVTIIEDKDGKYHILDGVTRTMIARQIEEGKHLKLDGTPYTLEELNWRVKIYPKLLEDVTDDEMTMKKLLYNLNTPNKASDIGNLILKRAKDFSEATYGKPLSELSNSDRKDVETLALKKVASWGIHKEDYLRKCIALAKKQGPQTFGIEIQDMANRGIFSDPNILSQITKIPDTSQRTQILRIIGDKDYPEEIKSGSIRDTLEFLRQNFSLDRFPIEEYAVRFRERLPIQNDLKKRSVTNMPKELDRSLMKYAKEHDLTPSEIIIEILTNGMKMLERFNN